MTNEELEEKARDYIDRCTKSAGFVILPEQLKQDFIDLYMAGARENQLQWHYPSKGEYPKEGENVLCYCKCRTEIKFCCVGHTIIGGDNKIRWWSSDRSEKLNVYAWKDITPPKEVKENEN